MTYAPGTGVETGTPMSCNVCGCRVPREQCERHQREPGYVALRDKYAGLFVIRAPVDTP